MFAIFPQNFACLKETQVQIKLVPMGFHIMRVWSKNRRKVLCRSNNFYFWRLDKRYSEIDWSFSSLTKKIILYKLLCPPESRYFLFGIWFFVCHLRFKILMKCSWQIYIFSLTQLQPSLKFKNISFALLLMDGIILI